MAELTIERYIEPSASQNFRNLQIDHFCWSIQIGCTSSWPSEETKRSLTHRFPPRVQVQNKMHRLLPLRQQRNLILLPVKRSPYGSSERKVLIRSCLGPMCIRSPVTIFHGLPSTAPKTILGALIHSNVQFGAIFRHSSHSIHPFIYLFLFPFKPRTWRMSSMTWWRRHTVTTAYIKAAEKKKIVNCKYISRYNVTRKYCIYVNGLNSNT